ncbi:hypothetical protein MHUMG1_10147 [Metarhizium humberi]|uniref:LysM domain-containing protein n=1 Tax=Metarhizium humberi TaxID=2596975 RepID=A0A9P8S3B8_9HYPO|nr:hypothetical protein MHUMG1_10147 [Metarhizium humberi]
MLAPSVTALAVAASSGVLDSIVEQGVNLRARQSNPRFSFDPNTSSYCTFWYDNDGSIPCTEILGLFSVSIDDFIRWNPSITPTCDKFLESRSFCVEASGEPAITSTSTSAEPTTTTKPSNGIQTPSPTQPDIIDSCNKFYWVNNGESCENVASKNGIPLQDFLAWNPKAGNQCYGLWANAYSCVSIIGYIPPTPSEPTNGVETPTPIQPGMVADFRGGMCINTGCSVGSLEIAAEGYCPDGQVQISYWEQPNCVGKWFGYGYTKRGQCRGVWTDGWKFKSLFLRCAKEEDDCVSQGTCSYDPEPDTSLC